MSVATIPSAGATGGPLQRWPRRALACHDQLASGGWHGVLAVSGGRHSGRSALLGLYQAGATAAGWRTALVAVTGAVPLTEQLADPVAEVIDADTARRWRVALGTPAIAAALVTTGLSLAAEDQRLLLLVDDLHRADRREAASLVQAVALVAGAGLPIRLAASRLGPPLAIPDGGAEHVALLPPTADELDGVDPSAASAVLDAADGSAAALATGLDALAGGLPAAAAVALVRAVVEHRSAPVIASLSTGARRCLRFLVQPGMPLWCPVSRLSSAVGDSNRFGRNTASGAAGDPVTAALATLVAAEAVALDGDCVAAVLPGARALLAAG